MSKGSKQRPINDKVKFDKEWDRIFGNNQPSHDALEILHTSNPNSVGYYGYNEKTDNYDPEIDD